MAAHSVIFRLTAAFTLFSFIVCQISIAQPIPEPDLKISAVPFQHIVIPENLGSVEQQHFASSAKPWVVFIRDAHSVIDAQDHIRELLDYLQGKYGIRLVALEGGREKLDPTLFRAFPEKDTQKKILGNYLARGELSGTEMAAILNPADAVYYGIEDWKLYEDHFSAYLRASRNQEALLKELEVLRESLDGQRTKIYTPEHNVFHEKTSAFREDALSLVEFLKYLRTLSPLENEADYPQLKTLMDSMDKDSKLQAESLDISVRRLAEEWKRNNARKFSKEQQMGLNEKYQSFVTGSLDPAAFLKFLLPLSEKIQSPLSLTPEMNELLGHAETLSTIKGTKLFEELDRFLREREDRFVQTPEARELSEKYRKRELLSELAKLEVDRDQIDAFNSDPENYLALLSHPVWMGPAVEFYRAALKRDTVLHQNMQDLMRKEKARACAVVLGGFHTKGFERRLREEGYSFMVVTPKMSSLKGHENYGTVMRGDLSYRPLLKTTLYDAFVRHATAKLVAELNEPDFQKVLKLWRDDLIRGLAKEGRVAQAGLYTQYIDLLLRFYIDKFGTENLIKKDRGQLLGSLKAELAKYQEDFSKEVQTRFQTQLQFFTRGLKELVQKRSLSKGNVQSLIDQTGALRPEALAAAIVLSRNSVLPESLTVDRGTADPVSVAAASVSAVDSSILSDIPATDLGTVFTAIQNERAEAAVVDLSSNPLLRDLSEKILDGALAIEGNKDLQAASLEDTQAAIRNSIDEITRVTAFSRSDVIDAIDLAVRRLAAERNVPVPEGMALMRSPQVSAENTSSSMGQEKKAYGFQTLENGFPWELNGQKVHVRSIPSDYSYDFARIRNYIEALTVGDAVPGVRTVYVPPIPQLVSIVREGEKKGLFKVKELRSMSPDTFSNELNIDRRFYDDLMNNKRLLFVSDWVNGPNARDFFLQKKASPEQQTRLGVLIGQTVANMQLKGLVAGDVHLGQFVVLGDVEQVLRVDLEKIFSFDWTKREEMMLRKGYDEFYQEAANVAIWLKHFSPLAETAFWQTYEKITQGQSLGAESAPLSREEQVREIFRRSAVIRPDAKTVAGFSEQEILAGARLAGLQPPQMELVEKELKQILPLAEKIAKKIKRDYSDHRILLLGRDFDLFEDAFRAWDIKNAQGFPGSTAFWKDFEKVPPGSQIRFFAQYGITKENILKGKKFLLADTGFKGTIGDYVHRYVSELFQLDSGTVRKSFPVRLIAPDSDGAAKGIKPFLSFDLIDPFKYAEIFPKLSLKMKSGFYSNGFLELLVTAIQTLPRYHGPYRKLAEDNATGNLIAVPDGKRIIVNDIDNLSDAPREKNMTYEANNLELVSPVAAMLIQKKVYDYFYSRRPLLQKIGSLFGASSLGEANPETKVLFVNPLNASFVEDSAAWKDAFGASLGEAAVALAVADFEDQVGRFLGSSLEEDLWKDIQQTFAALSIVDDKEILKAFLHHTTYLKAAQKVFSRLLDQGEDARELYEGSPSFRARTNILNASVQLDGSYPDFQVRYFTGLNEEKERLVSEALEKDLWKTQDFSDDMERDGLLTDALSLMSKSDIVRLRKEIEELLTSADLSLRVVILRKIFNEHLKGGVLDLAGGLSLPDLFYFLSLGMNQRGRTEREESLFVGEWTNHLITLSQTSAYRTEGLKGIFQDDPRLDTVLKELRGFDLRRLRADSGTSYRASSLPIFVDLGHPEARALIESLAREIISKLDVALKSGNVRVMPFIDALGEFVPRTMMVLLLEEDGLLDRVRERTLEFIEQPFDLSSSNGKRESLYQKKLAAVAVYEKLLDLTAQPTQRDRQTGVPGTIAQDLDVLNELIVRSRELVKASPDAGFEELRAMVLPSETREKLKTKTAIQFELGLLRYLIDHQRILAIRALSGLNDLPREGKVFSSEEVWASPELKDFLAEVVGFVPLSAGIVLLEDAIFVKLDSISYGLMRRSQKAGSPVTAEDLETLNENDLAPFLDSGGVYVPSLSRKSSGIPLENIAIFENAGTPGTVSSVSADSSIALHEWHHKFYGAYAKTYIAEKVGSKLEPFQNELISAVYDGSVKDWRSYYDIKKWLEYYSSYYFSKKPNEISADFDPIVTQSVRAVQDLILAKTLEYEAKESISKDAAQKKANEYVATLLLTVPMTNIRTIQALTRFVEAGMRDVRLPSLQRELEILESPGQSDSDISYTLDRLRRHFRETISSGRLDWTVQERDILARLLKRVGRADEAEVFLKRDRDLVVIGEKELETLFIQADSRMSTGTASDEIEDMDKERAAVVLARLNQQQDGSGHEEFIQEFREIATYSTTLDGFIQSFRILLHSRLLHNLPEAVEKQLFEIPLTMKPGERVPVRIMGVEIGQIQVFPARSYSNPKLVETIDVNNSVLREIFTKLGEALLPEIEASLKKVIALPTREELELEIEGEDLIEMLTHLTPETVLTYLDSQEANVDRLEKKLSLAFKETFRKMNNRMFDDVEAVLTEFENAANIAEFIFSPAFEEQLTGRFGVLEGERLAARLRKVISSEISDLSSFASQELIINIRLDKEKVKEFWEVDFAEALETLEAAYQGKQIILATNLPVTKGELETLKKVLLRFSNLIYRLEILLKSGQSFKRDEWEQFRGRILPQLLKPNRENDAIRQMEKRQLGNYLGFVLTQDGILPAKVLETLNAVLSAIGTITDEETQEMALAATLLLVFRMAGMTAAEKQKLMTPDALNRFLDDNGMSFLAGMFTSEGGSIRLVVASFVKSYMAEEAVKQAA